VNIPALTLRACWGDFWSVVEQRKAASAQFWRAPKKWGEGLRSCVQFGIIRHWVTADEVKCMVNLKIDNETGAWRWDLT